MHNFYPQREENRSQVHDYQLLPHSFHILSWNAYKLVGEMNIQFDSICNLLNFM
jgi:hypothetical protein